MLINIFTLNFIIDRHNREEKFFSFIYNIFHKIFYPIKNFLCSIRSSQGCCLYLAFYFKIMIIKVRIKAVCILLTAVVFKCNYFFLLLFLNPVLDMKRKEMSKIIFNSFLLPMRKLANGCTST
jgi:hypothetical protein